MGYQTPLGNSAPLLQMDLQVKLWMWDEFTEGKACTLTWLKSVLEGEDPW